MSRARLKNVGRAWINNSDVHCKSKPGHVARHNRCISLLCSPATTGSPNEREVATASLVNNRRQNKVQYPGSPVRKAGHSQKRMLRMLQLHLILILLVLSARHSYTSSQEAMSAASTAAAPTKSKRKGKPKKCVCNWDKCAEIAALLARRARFCLLRLCHGKEDGAEPNACCTLCIHRLASSSHEQGCLRILCWEASLATSTCDRQQWYRQSCQWETTLLHHSNF